MFAQWMKHYLQHKDGFAWGPPVSPWFSGRRGGGALRDPGFFRQEKFPCPFPYRNDRSSFFPLSGFEAADSLLPPRPVAGVLFLPLAGGSAQPYTIPLSLRLLPLLKALPKKTSWRIGIWRVSKARVCKKTARELVSRN